MNAVTAQARAAGQNVGLTSEKGNSSIDQARGQVLQAESDIAEAQSAVVSAQKSVHTTEASVHSAASMVNEAKADVCRYTAELQTACDNVQAANADVTRYTAELQTACENLQAANWAVETAQAQAQLSDANARRFTNLANEGVVTERQRDDYVTAANKDDAQLQSAMANANAANAQVASKQADLNRSMANANAAKAQVASKQADLNRSMAKVASSSADFQYAQSQLAVAKQDVGTARARIGIAMGEKAQYEGIRREALTTPTQIAISRSQHASAQSKSKEARAKVDEQQSILQSLYVKSPITGIVTTRIRDTGENVVAGSPILEVVDLNRLYLKAYVPEYQIGKVRLGFPRKSMSMRIPISHLTPPSNILLRLPNLPPKKCRRLTNGSNWCMRSDSILRQIRVTV